MRICIFFFAVFVAACSSLPISQKVRYDNYKVLRVIPKNEDELQLLKNVEQQWELLDFWKRPSKVGRAVDIMVSPNEELDLLNSLSRPGLTIDTWIPNVQDLIDNEAAELAKVSPTADFNYDVYHTYQEIADWMDDFVASNNGVTKVQVTTTFEGQKVYGLQFKMSLSARKTAYIQGGIHAREWISPATMINLARKFAEDYGTDAQLTAMLDAFIWIIVPVYNIDGYEFTWTNDRMWRKNRNDNDGAVCMGVDLNRNFDYQWGGAGQSKCGDTYQGTAALSEPENSGLKTFLESKEDVVLFIDFHAYGQYWLYSWGYTGSKLVYHPDKDIQNDMATAVETSIRSVHNTAYFVGESGPDMYPATGGSEDFGYGSLGVIHSYVVELRDQGRYGFVLPDRLIEPQWEEIYAGMKTLGTRLLSEQ